jgi:oxygen-independent coproporphyrinogen-3 oxidase
MTSPLTAAAALSSRPALAALPPLSLYIHIPWCVRKCPYCDFNSHVSKGAAPESAYIDARVSDLDYTLPKIWGRRVYSIFRRWHASLFRAAIDEILAAVRARVALEADKSRLRPIRARSRRKFRGFRDAGVNRLSIGIQSFHDAHLKALGRIHDSAEARRAVAIAQDNFDNINLDLMFALPGQTLAECEADVDTALSFATTHLSIYHLTLEANTLFHRFPPPLPDDDLAADMQDAIQSKLAAAGYANYETSAYARPGRDGDNRCRHNLNYWRFGDYLGIGAGAHGKISYPDRITREARFKQPQAFMDHAVQGEAIQEAKTVAATELPFEFMLNALRLTEGFTLAMFVERTGLPLTAILPALDAAEAKGLIKRDHVAVRPTARGRLFLNDLLEMFLPA